MSEVDFSTLVSLEEEDSALRRELNKAIEGLSRAPKTEHRPHICLNESEGMKVLQQIFANPAEANTAYFLSSYLDMTGCDIWLNVRFLVFINEICWPTNLVSLTPQQTAFVVTSLPNHFRDQVLEKVKAWYFGEFLSDVEKGLKAITTQFESGDQLLPDESGNRIFDIHRLSQPLEINYTEAKIAGESLYYAVVYGTKVRDLGVDGLDRADRIVMGTR